MNRILHHKVRLRCSPAKAFGFFTRNEHLEQWLCVKAKVKPELGGRYELFWSPEHPEVDSTIGCRITAFEPNRVLAFEWKGPKQYRRFMNSADPLTHVTVVFIPFSTRTAAGTEVHLVHTGWRSTKKWEEARLWFDRMWQHCLKKELPRYAGRK
jgi:uncharacterized protein YndB with AHSA1/START domain